MHCVRVAIDVSTVMHHPCIFILGNSLKKEITRRQTLSGTRAIWKVIMSRGESQGSSGGGKYFDPRFKQLLWYIVASTKGGPNRARILQYINSQPANPNQISNELKLDYKTIIHHLSVLKENGLVTTDDKETYGATYFLTPLMEKNYESFMEILAKIGKK